MKLASAELASVRALGLFLTEKCDGCAKALNQTFRCTIAGRPLVFCSAVCRDTVFFADGREARKRSTPGKCVYCRATLNGKRRGALYCDETCRKRAAGAGKAEKTGEAEITRTPRQSNQRLGNQKNGRQGNRIAGGPIRPERPGWGETA
jgi:hypothetical protein